LTVGLIRCNFLMGKVAVNGPFPGRNRQLFVHIRTVCVCVCVCGKRSDDVGSKARKQKVLVACFIVSVLRVIFSLQLLFTCVEGVRYCT
jgi:hypothetical protein